MDVLVGGIGAPDQHLRWRGECDRLTALGLGDKGSYAVEFPSLHDVLQLWGTPRRASVLERSRMLQGAV